MTCFGTIPSDLFSMYPHGCAEWTTGQYSGQHNREHEFSFDSTCITMGLVTNQAWLPGGTFSIIVSNSTWPMIVVKVTAQPLYHCPMDVGLIGSPNIRCVYSQHPK